MPTRHGTPIRVVLWDFGNVIVRWNPRTLYEKIFPDPAECDRFLSDVCTLAWHAPTDCGVTFAAAKALSVDVHISRSQRPCGLPARSRSEPGSPDPTRLLSAHVP